jgi:hypothetical protein
LRRAKAPQCQKRVASIACNTGINKLTIVKSPR